MQQESRVVPRIIKYGLLGMVIVLPFQTFLTVWAAQEFGHLYAITAWKEVAVVVLAALALYLAFSNKKLLRLLVARKFNLLLVAYALLFILYMPFAASQSQFFVGLAINLRFVLMFFVAQVVYFYYPQLLRSLLKAIAVTGVVVASVAILHVLLLAPNFLTNFGYDEPGQNTVGIPPAYHLVADSGLIRAQATLRGPNALGAYLIIPLAIWFYAFVKHRRMALSAFACGVIGLAILMSHSRSAWLAAAVVVALILMQALNFTRKHVSIMLVSLAAMAVLGFVSFDNNVLFRQLVLHDVVSLSTAQDSNAGHLQATVRGVRDVLRQPFGEGPGSAGPASALGGTDTEVSENYFIQVMQEVGILGGLLFLASQLWVGLELWRGRADAKVFVVLAAGVGLVLTNLLLHTWADETVAMTWWALAGAALPRAKGAK